MFACQNVSFVCSCGIQSNEYQNWSLSFVLIYKNCSLIFPSKNASRRLQQAIVITKFYVLSFDLAVLGLVTANTMLELSLEQDVLHISGHLNGDNAFSNVN